MKSLTLKNLLIAAFIAVLALAQTAPVRASSNHPTDKEQIAKLSSDIDKLDKSIDVTHKKMKEVKDVTFLPDIYFVLAELYVEKSRYLAIITKLQNPDTPIKDLDYFQAKKSKKEAIETYQRFIETFPKNENVDRALFYMAHEYRELGNNENMERTYARLIHDFPKSPFLAETRIILGDYFLDEKKDPRMALETYQDVLTGAPSPFIPIARYKTGWCYINMDKFHEALLAFEGVLTIDANVDLEKLPDVYKKSDIHRDALLALVWPYSEEKNLDPSRANALAYFERLSPNRPAFVKVLDKLQKRLMLKHKTDEALSVYFKLIDLTNDLERRLEYFEQFYQALRQSRKYWPLEALPDPLTATVIRARGSPDMTLKDKRKVEQNFEIYLRDIATRLQKRAKSSQQDADYTNASHAYEDYLQIFPRSRYVDAIMLDLAESYFSQKKYALAGLNYELLIRRQRPAKKSVLDSALQSYAYALKNREKLSKLETTQSREGFRDMGVRFLAAYPRDPASAMIQFNIARTYYDERDFGNAVKYFSAFIDAHPDHKEATTAGNLILDAYNQREDYEGLIKAGKKLIANRRLRDQQFKSDVQQIVTQAEYRNVQTVAGDPRNRQFAQTMLKFASKYQGTTLGDQALYEAYSALKAKKDPQMYDPGEQLLNKHGDSRYAKEVVGSMGQMALNTADYRRAASYFEIFARKFPNDPTSSSLLKSAANLRELMGDLNEAAEDYRDLGPSHAEDVARQFALAQDWSNLAQTLASRPVNTIRGTYWMGLALYRKGQYDQARPYFTKASKERARTYEEKKMAAHSLYLLATQALKNYQAIQLGGGGNEGALTKEKTARLQALEQQFKRVIAFGNGRWTIAALYQMGRANNDFAQFISNASIPAGLNPAQQAQYKQLVAQQAQNFQNKAKTYFASCVKNAQDYEVFTGFVAGCQSQGAQDVDETNEEKIRSKANDSYPAEATAIRRQLFDDSKNTMLLMKLSQAYVQNQDYAMARVIISHVLELKPSDAAAEAQLGMVLLFMNDTEGAANSFKTALSHRSKDPTALWGLAALYKHFGFEEKFRTTLIKARAAGSPAGILHPWLNGLMS